MCIYTQLKSKTKFKLKNSSRGVRDSIDHSIICRLRVKDTAKKLTKTEACHNFLPVCNI